MHGSALPPPVTIISARARSPSRLAAVWNHARATLRAALNEAVLYALGNPRSHWHGQAALRELTPHLRRDIGLPPCPPEIVPPERFEGHR
jgi:hypothetical protein